MVKDDSKEIYTEGKADDTITIEVRIVLKLTFTGTDSLSFPFTGS